MQHQDLVARLGTPGVWAFTDGMSSADAAAFATRVEALGFSVLWLPETIGRDPFAHHAWLAANSENLLLATGIANIFLRHPGAMKQAARTLAEQSQDRFMLGLGVSHRPVVAGLRKLDYAKPLTQMRHYLEAMDDSPYKAAASQTAPPRLLAALGPRMLELAAETADGAHPYFTTPEHTAHARSILGSEKLLCVEQKVVLTEDASVAFDVADRAIARYGRLPNYRNNWKRLGYSEDEIERRAPRFVESVVAWGNAEALRNRVDAHYHAGATHVCIQALSTSEGDAPDMAALEALAPAQG